LEPGNKEIVTAMSVKMRADIISYGEGKLRGELHSRFFEEPFVFTSLVRMIEVMETTFDTKGFPEKVMLPRTFGKPKERLRKNELDLNAHVKDAAAPEAQPEPGGIKCTFDIHVRFRQHAEWQGQLHWVEKDTVKDFSSILDMLKLIDNALVDANTG